jgi:hypothetical protein
VYTCPANRTQTYQVDISGTVLFALQPTARGFDTGAGSSWWQAVAATSVSDPAAIPITSGIKVTLTPTGTGLTITISNTNSFDIALWTPGDGGSIGAGPYLIAHGMAATQTNTTALTSTARTGGGSVSVDDSQWRQDVTAAQAMIDDIAHDLAMPLIVFDSVEIGVDPRRALGDVVTVQDTRSMATAQPVQIVGINHQLPAAGRHTTTLTVRACYPPTGWILGVTGRSELGTTTVLVA